MEESQVIEFAKYYIYTIEDNKLVNISVCEDFEHAKTIAMLFALHDPDYQAYYVSSISRPNTFCAGGGWYQCWQRDKETNKVITYSLS